MNKQFGRFELRAFLGRGGVSEVYQAVDPLRKERIALKVIHIQSTDRDRLVAEEVGADIQRRLHRHVPEIVDVYEYGYLGESLYIAMEYVEGTDLHQLLQRGPLKEQLALDIAIQLCRILEGIERLSSRLPDGSVIHGDIKPHNILLQSGSVRLLDFGVAKQIAHAKLSTTRVFGSIPYLSPEGISSNTLDRNTDLWALSVVLFQMAVGQLPFAGDREEEIHAAMLGTQRLSRASGCTPQLQRIIAKALSIDIADRYLSATALRSDLEDLLLKRPAEHKGVAGLDATRDTRSIQHHDLTPPGDPTPRTRVSIPGRNMDPTNPTDKAAVTRGRWGLITLLLVVGYCAYREGAAWVQARHLLPQLQAPLSAPELSKSLEEYRILRNGSFLHLGLDSLKQPLSTALVAAASDVAEAPLQDLAAIRQDDWLQARDWIAAAREITAEDATAHSRQLFCDANALRLSMLQELQAKDLDAAHDLFSRSLRELREALRMSPAWASPYVSILQLYQTPPTAAGWFTSDELRSALVQAAQKGYRLSSGDRAALVRLDVEEVHKLRQRAVEAADPGEAMAFLRQADHILATAGQSADSATQADLLWQRAEIDDQLREIEGAPASAGRKP